MGLDASGCRLLLFLVLAPSRCCLVLGVTLFSHSVIWYVCIGRLTETTVVGSEHSIRVAVDLTKSIIARRHFFSRIYDTTLHVPGNVDFHEWNGMEACLA